MARRPRIEYEGTIWHVMARGNGRYQIALDDEDRGRLREDLIRAAQRCEWQDLAFVLMGNPLHPTEELRFSGRPTHHRR